MEKRICIIIIWIIFTLSGYAQINKTEQCLEKIPKQKMLFQSPSNYKFTIDWINRNIDGAVIMHNVAIGKLKQALPNDTIQMQDITLTEINNNVKNTIRIDELDGLKFKISGDNFTNPDFYKHFPSNRVELIRWFIQDKVAFDTYGQMYLDSLKLNIPFYPDFFQNHQANFEQYVNFNTKKLNLTWQGISKINNKNCVLIYFESMYNPINADNDIMILDGRSCFWGHVWISIDTRQIEYGTMNEDLIYKMKLKASDYEQQINMQREIKLENLQ